MNPFTLITGAVMSTANTLTGGNSGSKSDTIAIQSSPKKSYMYTILLILVLGALIGTNIYLLVSQNDLKKKNQVLADASTSHLEILKTITTNVNTIGLRLGTNDLSFKYNLLPEITLEPIKSTFKGREDFVQISYLNELELFKTLSPEDQYQYLHMDKATKRARYINKL